MSLAAILNILSTRVTKVTTTTLDILSTRVTKVKVTTDTKDYNTVEEALRGLGAGVSLEEIKVVVK